MKDGTPVILFHGAAEHVEFDAPDGPWELRVIDEAGFLHVFNVHGITSGLLSLTRPLERYWQEGLDAAATYRPSVTSEDLDGYDRDDPKRISLERDRG